MVSQTKHTQWIEYHKAIPSMVVLLLAIGDGKRRGDSNGKWTCPEKQNAGRWRWRRLAGSRGGASGGAGLA